MVDKLIATPTNLIGHCSTFWSIAQLSDMLAIKFEGRRNPKTYTVLTVCFALLHPVFNKIFIASFCIFGLNWQKKVQIFFKDVFLKIFEKYLIFFNFTWFLHVSKVGILGKNQGLKNGQKLQKRHPHLHRPNLKNRRKVAGPVWIRDPRPNPGPGGSFFRLSRAHFSSELKCLSPLKTSGL